LGKEFFLLIVLKLDKLLRFFLWRPLKKVFSLCIAEYTFKGFFSIKNKLAKLNYFRGHTFYFKIELINKKKFK